MGALSEATQPFYITCLQQQATTHGEAVPPLRLYTGGTAAHHNPLNLLHLLNPLNPHAEGVSMKPPTARDWR